MDASHRSRGCREPLKQHSDYPVCALSIRVRPYAKPLADRWRLLTFVGGFGNRHADLMEKKLERHVEGPGRPVQRRLEQRAGRQGRGARLQPDPRVAILRFEHAVTSLSESQRPRRSVPVRARKEQNGLFIDAELGNAGDMQPLALGGPPGQRENDLVTRTALDGRDDPEPVPRYDITPHVIHETGAGDTLDVGDRLRPLAERIEPESQDGGRISLRRPENQRGKHKNGSKRT